MGPFEIDKNHIEALDDYDLTELLQRLLFLEAQKLGLPQATVAVSLNIDAPDGGEDGKIEWSGGPDPATSDWIPTRCTLFQAKATPMGPADCKSEVFNKDGTDLKARVKAVAKDGGSYVLFYSKSCEGQYADDRVAKIREAFGEKAGVAVAQNVAIRVYGSEKIARWTNQHASAVTFVMERRGIAAPAALQSWTSWSEEHPTRLSFYMDAARLAVRDAVRTGLLNPKRTVRLVGLSGLGKSRLALEVFRIPADGAPDLQQAALSRSCVYMADGDKHASDVIAAIRAMKDRGVSGVVVVDECPLELHQKLSQIVRAPKSKLSLLTLDFDPTSVPGDGAADFFCLAPLAQADMEALLRASALDLPEEHVATVASMAGGFPRMAELLVRLLDNEDGNLWALDRPEVFRNLVIRRAKDPDFVWETAIALATLEHVGADGDVRYELDALCEHVMGGEDSAKVYRAVRELEDSGIVYRRGDYVRLTPLPLAVVLAALWWNGVRPDLAVQLLTGDALPQSVVDAMKAQLARLRGHVWVERLVAEIVSVTGPFGRRDLVDSATGSRLLSSLAEVNPEAVANLLAFHFGGITPDEASRVVQGRRDLVWCLEKLAWWSGTFHRAARVLLLFAAGENESWGNNASAQFKQLFHLYLAGTEVPAYDRLAVLRDGLQSEDARIVSVCIDALVESLSSGHFHRMGGPEAQGGGLPRVDWAPTSLVEAHTYWAEVLDLLSTYLVHSEELGEAVRKGVAQHARGLVLGGCIDLVETVVTRVFAAGLHWPEMLEALRTAENYDGERYGGEVREHVEALIARLEPTTLEDRLRMVVSTPSWNELRKDDSGTVTVVAEERAAALAVELAPDPDSLINLLPIVLIDEQRQGYRFGRALGQHLIDPFAFLAAGGEALRMIPPERRNAIVLMGVIAAVAEVDVDRARAFVRGWLTDADLRACGLDLLRAVGPNDDDSAILVMMLGAGEIDPRQVQMFSYGRAADGISDRAFAELLCAVLHVGEAGRGPAIELLGMRLHQRAVSSELVAVTKEVLLSADAAADANPMGGHHFEQLVKKAIGADPQDGEFIRKLAANLVATSERFGLGRRHVPAVLADLLRVRVDVVWPLLRAELSSGDWARAARVTTALGKWFHSGPDLIGLVGQNELLSWASTSSETAYWAAKLIEPLRDEPDESDPFPNWNPFVVELLRRHGADKDVRSAIGAKISSGAWSGSAVPRLERHRRAFHELLRIAVPEVREWATKAVAYLDEEIQSERKRDEEAEFGIHRR